MIRYIVGFLMVFGAVGGLDSATDEQLIPLLFVALLGLTVMHFGLNRMEK